MPSVPVTRRAVLAVLVVAMLNQSATGATIPGSRSRSDTLTPPSPNIYYSDHIMNDPSFLQCLSQHSTADPVDIVNIVATCYGFVGRPRYKIVAEFYIEIN